MRSKIGNRSQPYDSLAAFERDLRVIVRSYIQYNGAASNYVCSCVELHAK